jgi:hypothetical protein
MHPETGIWGNCVLVAALGQLDRLEEAADALTVLLRREPKFSCKFFLDALIAVGSEFREHMIEGLRKAGVPEECCCITSHVGRISLHLYQFCSIQYGIPET